MNEKNENDVMLFVFYILVLSALGGLIYAASEHMLSYLQLQWLTAIGLGFMFMFLLKETLVLLFTGVYVGLKKAWSFLFGSKDENIEKNNYKALEKNIEGLEKNLESQANLIEEYRDERDLDKESIRALKEERDLYKDLHASANEQKNELLGIKKENSEENKEEKPTAEEIQKLNDDANKSRHIY